MSSKKSDAMIRRLVHGSVGRQGARKEGRSYHFGMGPVMVPNCNAIAHTAIRRSSPLLSRRPQSAEHGHITLISKAWFVMTFRGRVFGARPSFSSLLAATPPSDSSSLTQPQLCAVAVANQGAFLWHICDIVRRSCRREARRNTLPAL